MRLRSYPSHDRVFDAHSVVASFTASLLLFAPMRRCAIRRLQVAGKKVSQGSAPVDPVIPRDPQSPGLDRDFNSVAVVEPVEVIDVHRQAFKMLPWTPRPHQQPAAAAHYPFHVEAAFDSSRVIDNVFLRVEPPVDEQRGSKNPRQWNKSRVDALENFDFLAIAREALQDHGQEQHSEKNDP